MAGYKPRGGTLAASFCLQGKKGALVNIRVGVRAYMGKRLRIPPQLTGGYRNRKNIKSWRVVQSFFPEIRGRGGPKRLNRIVAKSKKKLGDRKERKSIWYSNFKSTLFCHE